ncbi:unnamed protein product [Lathyrus sativus]|nr:unnamed protein product [Lathyrus sativus]
MSQRNIITTCHFNGVVSTNTPVGFSFNNTDTYAFKIHVNSDFFHFKDRMETKLARCVEEIIYRHPTLNEDDCMIFYIMTPIKTDEDVKAMFRCHVMFGQLPTIEVYVRLVQNPETFPTQETQSHWYGMSQTSDDEPTQNNLPFIPNEEVGEPSDDDILEEIRMQDIFGNSDDEDNEDEDIVVPSTQPIRAQPISLYNPPAHMQNICAEYDDTTSVFGNAIQSHIGDEIDIGMEFKNKEACILALQHWHITHCVDYWVCKSDNERYVIKCKKEECKFKCRASFRQRNSKWVIGKLSGSHTCTTTSMAQDHSKLSSEMVSHSIRELVNSDASLKVKVIIAHILEKYGYIISYRKAWIAKCKAVESLYDNWETSYDDLPQWLLVMKTFLPGTVMDLQTIPAISSDGSQISGKRTFLRLFWAFRPCINGFAYCKLIVQVDGTWLYGKYRGTLLTAVAQDGNANIFPVAFALVEGETKEAWSFFLRNLRLHVTPQPNLCLISDRHESIKSAYNNPENGWQNPPSSHVYCIRHIAQNFMREIKDKVLRKLVVNMGYALTEASFHYYHGEIRRSNAEALNWIDNIPREKWARAFDGGQRWGHMTSNLAGAINSVLKATRNLPITALVQSTYYRMGSLFGKRGHKWTKMLSSGKVFTDGCNKGMAEEVAKANTHNVMQFDRERFCFMVQEKINYNDGRPKGTFSVDLRNRRCDCGKFQTFHLPCSHVIAECSSIRQDYAIHIPEVFTILNVFKIYKESFLGLPHEENWPKYEGFTLCHDDSMRRNKKGRPKSSRIRTEMDDVEKEKRQCGICREIGHMRRKCPNVVGPSNRPNR